MRTIDRIKQYIDYKSISLNSFDEKIGAANGYIGKQIKKSASVGSDMIEKIVCNYEDINPIWLITGKGSMLKDNPKPGTESAEQDNLIPFYDTLTMAGTFANAELSPVMQPAEMIDAGDWFRDATAAMRVHGDSMYPEYPSGSIVVMKEVKNKRLVVYGQDYVFETSEFRVIKRMQRGPDEKCWLAYSTNEELWQTGPLAGKPIHEPFEIYKEDVARLFIVLGSVTRTQSTNIIYNNH